MRTYAASALLFFGTLASGQNIFTVAGIPYTHRNSVDGQAALSAPLGNVYGLAIDKATGRLLLNDQTLVLRLEADGSLLTVAGIGPTVSPALQFASNIAGSPPPAATLASLLNPVVLRGMTQDSAGNLYLSDAGDGRVYRVAKDGTVTTFAGGGLALGSQSDGGPATAARVGSPRGLVFDSKGNLDIAEVFCNCIRQVTPQGIISTVYTASPVSPAPNRPPNLEGLAIDAQDNLYFTEFYGNVVVKVAPNGSATTIAGTGPPGFSGDGGLASAAQLSGPSGVTVDAGGNLFIADTMNNRIRTIAPDGTINTIAGTGTCGFSGDGGPAIAAQLCGPAQTVLDGSGNLLIADFGNQRVRRMASDGNIATIVGSGMFDPNLSNSESSGNGGPAIHATFNLVGGTAFDAAGNLYVSELLGNVIRKIGADGRVSTYAGAPQRGSGGDGGPAIEAQLFNPGPLAVGPDGALYVISADSRVRKITMDGIIHAVAGTGTGTGLNRSQGDGGPAVMATLNEPGGVAFDQQGNIYIADTSNARIRKIDKNGIITTVAGPGQQGVDYYNAVAVDPQGNLYVAWTHATLTAESSTVNRVNPDGSLTPVAGSGQPCTGGAGQFTNDGAPAKQVRLCAVTGMTMDKNGVLYLSEGSYSLVLRLMADGTIQRVAGNTAAVNVGDGGPVLQARLAGGQGWSPQAVTFDPAGNMYIAEPGFNIVRQVTTKSYTPAVSPDHIDATRVGTQTITVAANMAEPFPYAVRVTTDDGGSWLQTNRATGFTGEAIGVNIQATGLRAGVHRGTVSVLVSAPVGGTPITVDVPVSLILP